MSGSSIMVADIGGTNARFAAYIGGDPVITATYDTANCDDLAAVAAGFCETMPQPPTVAVAAVAGPVRDGVATLTNGRHSLSGQALSRATGARRACVINDFAAAAWATPGLTPQDVTVISGASDLPPGTRVAIGPGTGLGVGAMIYDGHRYHAVAGEGGHMGVGPRDLFEISVFNALYADWPEVFFGHPLKVEAEALLSGSGLPRLYRAVQSVEGAAPTDVNAATILDRSRTGEDKCAAITVAMFKAHLAQLAGDVSLAFGAGGGVFLIGGVAQKNPWLFDDGFAASLAPGGRFTEARRALNIYLVNRTDTGITGAYTFARQWLSDS